MVLRPHPQPTEVVIERRLLEAIRPLPMAGTRLAQDSAPVALALRPLRIGEVMTDQRPLFDGVNPKPLPPLPDPPAVPTVCPMCRAPFDNDEQCDCDEEI